MPLPFSALCAAMDAVLPGSSARPEVQEALRTAGIGDAVTPSGRPIPVDPDAGLHQAEAAFLLGLSERTLEGLRLKGLGPPFYKLGKAVRYTRAQLLSWRAAQERRSTSDAGRTK